MELREGLPSNQLWTKQDIWLLFLENKLENTRHRNNWNFLIICSLLSQGVDVNCLVSSALPNSWKLSGLYALPHWPTWYSWEPLVSRWSNPLVGNGHLIKDEPMPAIPRFQISWSHWLIAHLKAIPSPAEKGPPYTSSCPFFLTADPSLIAGHFRGPEALQFSVIPPLPGFRQHSEWSFCLSYFELGRRHWPSPSFTRRVLTGRQRVEYNHVKPWRGHMRPGHAPACSIAKPSRRSSVPEKQTGLSAGHQIPMSKKHHSRLIQLPGNGQYFPFISIHFKTLLFRIWFSPSLCLKVPFHGKEYLAALAKQRRKVGCHSEERRFFYLAPKLLEKKRNKQWSGC